MSDINPYASPLNCDNVADSAIVEPRAAQRGLYHKGNQLVMHKRADMPDRCVKSNQLADGRRLRRRFAWLHPLVYLTLPLGLVIFILLMVFLRKEATIDIGLSRQWFRKRRRVIFIGWMTALLGIAIAFASRLIPCAMPEQATWIGWGLPLGITMLLGGAIYGALASQLVAPARITDDYVWLKGVHPDLLADLPPWPNRP